MEKDFGREIEDILLMTAHVKVAQATAKQLYAAVCAAAMHRLYPLWQEQEKAVKKRAAYFSAEFLMGRMVFSNLFNMRLLTQTEQLLSENGVDIRILEEIGDAALGNGGLGRLAACFLDAAATQGLALDGYGIRYRYGIFRQKFENGFQKEEADDWTRCGDSFSVRREEERVRVQFGDQTVWAVPYDMPIIGFGCRTVNTLRLWQAEPLVPFDFSLFNAQKYAAAFAERDAAETISAVLYPNDDGMAGKKLRLKQQYFFVSASLQDMLRRFKQSGETDLTQLSDRYAVQLNDTHPVVAIPELIRLLLEEGTDFGAALDVARRMFAYTNHTIMPEALETWDIALFRQVLPTLYPIVRRLQLSLRHELGNMGVTDFTPFDILSDRRVHMARLALFGAHAVNGVAAIHTELLKTRVLPDWYRLFPTHFHNITNGITQRRWLALANPELAAIITERIGDGWLTHLEQLRGLEKHADDPRLSEQLRFMRQQKKKQLAAYMEKKSGLLLRWDFLLDVQIKRLHEYKRQLLNAFSILDIYFRLKDGTLTDFQPTAFLFGAKAAPGYRRAKAIIKYINEISRMIANDATVSDRMQVLFVPDYGVSYAEKLIPAADISEQISTAGTEASGTSNMKFMLNGALTLGTYDGANIEIVEHAGIENNYIFGATVEELQALRPQYDPKALLAHNDRLRRVAETLIDGTFSDDSTGMFAELYRSLTEADWQQADYYYLFGDFDAYSAARLRANADSTHADSFFAKSLHNIAGAGYFSADRAVLEYAHEIWTL